MIKLEVDGQIDLHTTIPIVMEYLLWEKPTGNTDMLWAGQYIVEKVTADEVILAAGRWDKKGNVTYHSSKHTWRIRGKDNVKALRNALELVGPKEWSPKKP